MKGRVSRGKRQNTVTLVLVVGAVGEELCPACKQITHYCRLGDLGLKMCSLCDTVRLP